MIGLTNWANKGNVFVTKDHYSVRTKGYSTVLLDPTQVESSQIQWPVPSINAEPVDIFPREE